MTSRPRVAVIGGGPIGIEAALYARRLDYTVRVYEAGKVGEHLSRWGHVILFTPNKLNTTALGLRRLEEEHGRLGLDPEHHPTGHALRDGYLVPLSRLPELTEHVFENTRVQAIGRGKLLKGDPGAARVNEPFRLLVSGAQGERVDEAEIVLDSTGVYGQPNHLGQGGIPAPGEGMLGEHLSFGVPDVTGKHRADFEGKTVLVVGGGFSAATTVVALGEIPGTKTLWATRNEAPPVAEIENDPLPVRLELTRTANRLATDRSRVHHLAGTVVESLEEHRDGAQVALRSATGVTLHLVDRIVVQTGFHPDLDLHRELQVHSCYASEGPMKLAASLLGEGSADCMTQKGFGPESLRNPEPEFFVLGHKSYGRNSHFLLRIGHEQIRDVFRLITGDSSLDLYQSETAGV